MIKAVVFLLGLVGGSFIGVVVRRTEEGESWLKGRSKCDQCGRELAWWENIPLLSFLLLKGRCRTCRSPIPRWYPLIELAGGIVFLLTFWHWQKISSDYLLLFIWLLLAMILLFIFVFDWRHQLILDQAIGLLFFLGVISFLLSPAFFSLKERLFSALIGGGSLFLLYLLTRGKGMGWGDIKLSLFIGFFLGGKLTLLALYLAFLTGGLLGVIMLVLKKKKLKEKIAFGPFLVIGTLISWWWGEKIIYFIRLWLGV